MDCSKIPAQYRPDDAQGKSREITAGISRDHRESPNKACWRKTTVEKIKDPFYR
jgi:hypothetical protein